MKKLINILSLVVILTILLCGCEDFKFSSSEVETVESCDLVSAENIVLPCDNYSCEGKNYNEVVEIFTNAGFTNVKSVSQKGDSNKETRKNGSVIAVNVNGDIIFSKGALCSSDIEIRVYYVISNIEDNSSSKVTLKENTTSSSQTFKSEETSSSKEVLKEGTTKNNIEKAEDDKNKSVWVTEKGTKYHKKSTCSGMKNPIETSKEIAEEQGYEPCKRCYKK